MPTNRWINTTAALVTWWIIGSLLVVMTIFAQIGTAENTTQLYGFMHGITAMVLVMVVFSYVARQRANNLKWRVGSVVFLLCVVASIVLSTLTMQNAFLYGRFDQSASLWNLLLQIAGPIALLFLDNRKLDDQYQHRDDNGL